MLFKRKRIERADMVGAARSGSLVSCASVETTEDGLPVLSRLFTQHADTQADVIHVLQREWKRRVPATALVLDRGQYSLAATCLLYTSPSPRDKRQSRMPSSA